MKRKFKRVSKRTLSVILAIMMALSTMFVGIVSVDAANNGDNLYVYYGTESQFTSVSSKPMTYSSNLYTTVIDFTGVAGWTWYLLSISTSVSDRKVCWNDQPKIISNTDKIQNFQSGSRGEYTNLVKFETNDNASAGTSDLVKVTYDITANTITFAPGDSEPPTEPTTEPTTTSPTDPTDHVAKWALNGNFSTDTSNNTGWNTNFSAAKLVGAYESSFATGEVFSVSLELDSAKYFRLIKKDDSNNEYRPVGSGNSVDHDLIEKGNNSQESACNTEIGSDGAFYLPEGSYTLYVDQSGATPKVWCTIDGGSDLTPGAITLSDDTAVNGSLSFKAEGNTSGTADIDKNVTITAKPFAGFTCSGITVSYTKPVTAPDAVPEKVTQDLTVTDNTATFTVPDVQPNKNNEKEISFAASFTLDKVSYLSTKGDGLWIDVAPDKEDTTATLIKWNNYYGHDHNTNTNPYTFYVPKKVDLSNAKIYNGFGSDVTVNGKTIASKSFGFVSLNVSDNISVSGAYNDNIKVMQGSTNAMFLYTTKKGNETPLNTKTYAGWDDINSGATKNDEKTDGGSCVTMDNDPETPEISSAMALESVKGRGNSSWEASARRFGKYAYNMKLVDKTTLFGMATHTKKSAGSKSWCLLANNADESMLRNALAYQLAADVGLYNSPEFRFVDIYDNGEYMGSYLVTEKVDVGTSKLVDSESLEDLNEDAGLVFDEDSKNKVYNASYNGKNYSYCYTSLLEGDDSNVDLSKATYLLEFEIEDRYEAEACWFITPQGQHVVVKSPEFATQREVQYIAEKFIDMESKVFENFNNTELSKYIDLDSFARMYLVQELSSNLDSASTSYYVTYDCSKGVNARFVASPVWDYDWAFGQYESLAKYDVNGIPLDPKDTKNWYAKNKRYDDSSYDTADKYSIQSKLANNLSFQQVIKKVWNGTDTQEGFYAKVQKYYGDNSQIDQWYNEIKASVNMNETRWGFIKNNNIENWGSSDTGDNHSDAVNYLENTFLSNRANWLNEQFMEYPAYTQIATPTLTAYQADGKTELTGEVAVGDSIVLKADTTEIFVTYELYKGSEMVASNDDGVFTISAENGTYEYTVKTLYGASNRMTSNAVSVTASGESAKLTGVSLSTSSSAVAGTQITLKATPQTEGTVTGITYSYYMSNDNAASDDDTAIRTDTNLASCTATVPDTANTYYYYVKATFGETTVTSTLVPVEVTEQQGTHNVTFKFKAPSTSPYTPTITLDGTSYIMTRTDECLGSIYTGSLKIYWYSVDILVDSTKDNTIRITTRTTDLNAVYTDKFNGSEYYLAVDNLVNGTEVVDLTAQPEHIRNYYHTPLHMVHSDDISDGSLGFTYVEGKRYRMGSYLVNGIATFSIDSVTAIQKLAADSIDVSELQNSLFDCNLDGVVDINDATLMQKALAQ